MQALLKKLIRDNNIFNTVNLQHVDIGLNLNDLNRIKVGPDRDGQDQHFT